MELWRLRHLDLPRYAAREEKGWPREEERGRRDHGLTSLVGHHGSTAESMIQRRDARARADNATEHCGSERAATYVRERVCVYVADIQAAKGSWIGEAAFQRRTGRYGILRRRPRSSRSSRCAAGNERSTTGDRSPFGRPVGSPTRQARRVRSPPTTRFRNCGKTMRTVHAGIAVKKPTCPTRNAWKSSAQGAVAAYTPTGIRASNARVVEPMKTGWN